MNISIFETDDNLGSHAAQEGVAILNEVLSSKSEVNVILATGASQLKMLDEFVKSDLPWERINFFHLDEYVGINVNHPASFCKYLKERVELKLPCSPKSFNYIDTEQNLDNECLRLSKLISKVEVDVAFIGIGENGHIAFNDPPANFDEKSPYIVVDLDRECRYQQYHEGWFDSLDEVPQKAISMSINQIMKSNNIICSVPGIRKSEAVKNCLEKEIAEEFPATILKDHKHCHLFLDKNSSSLLNNQHIEYDTRFNHAF